ncbi:Uncharacterised protein [Streptococcus pneumoniae]|nr:Uncharacterised protein [Streptococcus pneumoniae]
MFQKAYGVSASEVAEAVAPITDTVIIGPPNHSYYQKSHLKDERDERIVVKINEKVVPSEDK